MFRPVLSHLQAVKDCKKIYNYICNIIKNVDQNFFIRVICIRCRYHKNDHETSVHQGDFSLLFYY